MKKVTAHARTRTAALLLAGAFILLACGAGALAIARLSPSDMTPSTATPETLWGTSDPPGISIGDDTRGVELGTDFSPTVPGTAIGVRFWKSPENTGTHVGNLWSNTGTLLATAPFVSETASGWQTARFDSPVSLTAGNRYTVSYFSPEGRYAATADLTKPEVSSEVLSVRGQDSGTFAYGESSSFPTNTWRSSGYWTDVLFVPTTDESTPAERTPPPARAEAPSPPSDAPFAGANSTGPIVAGFNPERKYTGPLTITTAGTVIRDQIIPAGLRIEADDVTVQGNIIEGPTEVSWDQAAIHVVGNGARILDNTIRGASSTDWRRSPVSGAKLVGHDVVFSRNNMYWIAGDGVSLYGDNAQVIGNWVHDFVDRDVVHFDGLHYPGEDTTAPGLIRDNTVELWVPNSGMTAALSFPDTASRIVVDHNLIAGGNYAIMGGGAGITISNNLFWTHFSGRVGFYGTHAHLGEVGTVRWSSNSYTSDGKTPKSTVKY